MERLFLVVSSSSRSDVGAGMMVKVGHSGVQTQEFLSAFPSSESLLRSFLSPCGSMFLLDNVVASGRGEVMLPKLASQQAEGRGGLKFRPPLPRWLTTSETLCSGCFFGWRR